MGLRERKKALHGPTLQYLPYGSDSLISEQSAIGKESCEDVGHPQVESHSLAPGLLSKALSSVAENYSLFVNELLAMTGTTKET